jgi:putative acetyltransferase
MGCGSRYAGRPLGRRLDPDGSIGGVAKSPPEIRPVLHPEDVEAARELFEEYARSLPFELEFQDFEEELRSLPGEYAPPRGRILLARVGGELAGCVALRPWDGERCEMKRMYARPRFRGRGVGRALADAVMAEARAIGYRWMRLDTVPGMDAALALYRSLGFRDIPPYRHNPIPGAVYLEAELRGPP